MSTEIAVRNEDTLDAKVTWAKTMAAASLLPQQYRNNPGNLLYALEYADALGIDRINAITSIHVINGKPSASADLIAGLIRKAGHRLRVTGDDTYAVAQIIRADDPDFTYEARWDMAKAKAAGLNTATWKNYPGAMLRARAITEVARMGASDALYGVIYTPEELGAQVDGDGSPVAAAPAPAASGRERLAQAAAATVPTENVEAITDEQRKKLHALVNELGLTREQKLAGAAHHAGRPVESTTDLTKAEATRVIDALQAKAAERTVASEAGGEVIDAEVVEPDTTVPDDAPGQLFPEGGGE